MRSQLEDLVAHELWDSAEILGGFLVSASADGADGVTPGERAQHLALLADALMGKREHRRALQYYRQALQFNRLGPRVVPGAGAATPGGAAVGGGGGARGASVSVAGGGGTPMTPGPMTPAQAGAGAAADHTLFTPTPRGKGAGGVATPATYATPALAAMNAAAAERGLQAGPFTRTLIYFFSLASAQLGNHL